MQPHAVIGLLAPVDAGKTTLAEALLYCSGAIRKQGRVDHGDTYLDFYPIERDRGITVSSKQMVVEHAGARLMFIDAPGHADFGLEAERCMQVLDLAVLVVSANDGVRGHTKALWRLLSRYGVPTVLFVNKMDQAGADRDQAMRNLRHGLAETCVDVERLSDPDVQEALATADEAALEEYLEYGSVSLRTFQSLFARRAAFPCLFGSALRLDGIEPLLDFLVRLCEEGAGTGDSAAGSSPSSTVGQAGGGLVVGAGPNTEAEDLAARIYKVSHDERGERICWLKVTHGILRAKKTVSGGSPHTATWTDKVDQLRVYNGPKFSVVQEVPAGWTCAATGLRTAIPGDGVGTDPGGQPLAQAPVLEYCAVPNGCDAHAVHQALRVLADEDPLLAVTWDEEHQESHVHLMGTIQEELLRHTLAERFGLTVGFGAGSIVYRETIAAPTTGIGHFEPLRHYAEVHLLIEPLRRGAGVEFGTVCPEDELDRNWQRLILTNAMERPHRGVLMGAALDDVRITLLAGRAHLKHTEGGDFRQATYRAIRQGLMAARDKAVLLEPWYRFELQVPAEKVGRALADLQRMEARFGTPETEGDTAALVGEAPVATMRDYPLQVAAYTSGMGSLTLEFLGYEPCHNAEEVVAAAAYDPVADLPNTPDSVFCSHGAGYPVPWDEVASHAHVSPNPSTQRPWRRADARFFGATP